jgi:hypothetical protein
MASVGQELLNVPFPEMVLKLALGIAEAQKALDENSVETAIALGETTVPLVFGITQTIAADGTVSFTDTPPIDVSLLQIGLLPTFYQFSESTIEVTMDIKTTTSRETNVKVGVKAKAGFRLLECLGERRRRAQPEIRQGSKGQQPAVHQARARAPSGAHHARIDRGRQPSAEGSTRQPVIAIRSDSVIIN